MIAMQSSGVGNCINALGLPARLPRALPDAGDDARPVGRVQSLAGADGPGGQADAGGHRRQAASRSTRPTEVGETFAAAADIAFNSRISAAVLVSQRIIGAKGFGQK